MGKCIVITGAGTGLGRALARSLVGDGHNHHLAAAFFLGLVVDLQDDLLARLAHEGLENVGHFVGRLAIDRGDEIALFCIRAQLV